MKEIFAERLRTSMTNMNIKQCELVKLTNIPKATISNYLNAKYMPKVEHLLKICEVLGVDFRWLFGK